MSKWLWERVLWTPRCKLFVVGRDIGEVEDAEVGVRVGGVLLADRIG